MGVITLQRVAEWSLACRGVARRPDGDSQPFGRGFTLNRNEQITLISHHIACGLKGSLQRLGEYL